MAKKRRPRLEDGDAVEVVNVPDNAVKWRGRRGMVKGVRGDDRTWSVMFARVVGKRRGRSMRVGSDMMVFRRHELQKVR